ncbi:MAG: V-type ATPase 116kDa subunit family protein [Thermoproteota archaeon]
MLSSFQTSFWGNVHTQSLLKLEVVVREEDIGAVLLFLGRMNVAHSINVSEELDQFNGLVEPYEIPCEVINHSSNIFKRINQLIKKLELEPLTLAEEVSLPPRKTLKEILDTIEQDLSEVEERSQTFIESLNLTSDLAQKIDHTLHAWGVAPKQIKEVSPVSRRSPQETILACRGRFSEVKNRFEKTEEAVDRCSSLLSRIEGVSENLDSEIPKESVKKVSFPPDEEFLKSIAQLLSELENSLKVYEGKEALIQEVSPLKATIVKIMDQIPEAKQNLINQMLKLRSLVESARHAIKTDPELQTIHHDLSTLYEEAREVAELINVEKKMGRCANTVVFEAWVPASYFHEVAGGIEKITNGECVVEGDPPSEEGEMPTMVTHVPKIFEAFEKMTFALGYPSYGEINPVWFMVVTFPLLFGIMFADVGQGAILLIAGVALAYVREKVDIEEVGDIPSYLLMSSGLLLLCGISAIAFGFLFGEFFGPSGVLQPITLIEIGPFQIGGFDPIHNPLGMLRFSILLGVVLLSLGLVLRVVNHVRKRKVSSALIAACWLWLLLGGFFMWIYWGGISNITRWFGEGLFMFLGLTVLPAGLIAGITIAWKGVMEGIELSIEILLESLDHTISFSRLAALSLTHAALNRMFLIIAGVETGGFTLKSIPILAVGTILALGIEGVIIFVHTLRLQWVELLPEFYSAQGFTFKPLQIKSNKIMKCKCEGTE